MPPHNGPLNGTRILVIEDDPETNRLLSVLLTGNGCEVDCCFDGESALVRLAGDPYHGVVLDLILPVVGGLEILDQVNDQNPEALSRFLVVTASRRYGRLATSLNVPVIQKPFDLDELLGTLAACAGRGSLRVLGS